MVEDLVTPSDEPDKEFKLLKVSYKGECQIESVKKGKDIRADEMCRVKAGQLIFSVMRATDGAIGIVPAEADGALATKTSYNVF